LLALVVAVRVALLVIESPLVAVMFVVAIVVAPCLSLFLEMIQPEIDSCLVSIVVVVDRVEAE